MVLTINSDSVGPYSGYVTKFTLRVNAMPGGITELPFLGGDLDLQVGGVSNVTVKYGEVSFWTRTRELLHWRGPAAIPKNRRDLSSERAVMILSKNVAELTHCDCTPT
jgi:hypothetical protein